MADLQNGFNSARGIDLLLEAKCVNRPRVLESVAAKPGLLGFNNYLLVFPLEGQWRVKSLYFPLG